jgi:hypothetical protein
LSPFDANPVIAGHTPVCGVLKTENDPVVFLSQPRSYKTNIASFIYLDEVNIYGKKYSEYFNDELTTETYKFLNKK